MNTVVVGLGNPVLSDDGVGIHVARAVSEALPPGSSVVVREAFAGGMRLLDALVGFDHAVIIDALWTGDHPPGTIVHLAMDDLGRSRNTPSMHDMDLPTAIEFGSRAGLKIPSSIDLWGVEVEDARTFSEELTDSVHAAVPAVVTHVLRSARQHDIQSAQGGSK